MKPDGLRLKELIEKEGYTPKDVYQKGIMTRSNLYYYFNLKKLKKGIVVKVLESVNIPVEKFYTPEKEENIFSEPSPTYTISSHQGKNLQTLLDSKGVSVVHFASSMSISRPTAYKLFSEKELPTGVLLESAYVLGVPVAAIKGRGTGEKSFEKDIYLELKAINDKLATLLKFANKT